VEAAPESEGAAEEEPLLEQPETRNNKTVKAKKADRSLRMTPVYQTLPKRYIV
jgi:hypothetical protein